ncbi:aldehyde ferredoxin oxidoreductase family protein [Desulfobacula sp.]|uniref:aldehyde ferredoxin oxidoreductase family protein n=1 Tax=Desulfobacula sp. TaxID=2593537 RepID=UPI00261E2451|nr:aldehyde ferredoxin oxidoreductase C-terminal domain-containing protein [Desulfobacula sp.]
MNLNLDKRQAIITCSMEMNGDMKMGSAKRFGQLLNVDLSSSQCYVSAFPETALEYIGGRGFNIWYLYHHLASGTDPLAPENMLLLSCGLLTGSSAPTSARLHINALSPLTGILGSSNIGGYAGAWLRSCNIASIIITGKSQKPVYLYIDSNGARLEDASHLWGHDTFETQEMIKLSHNDKKLKILAIGPGGESKVRFGAIISERDHAAGRTGMGSVMGSKNLKAIVISKGSHKHFHAITPLQKKAVNSYVSQIKNSTAFDFFSKYGGAGYVKWVNDFGIMGSRNYSKIGIKQIEKIDCRQLEKNIVRSSGCFRCPVQCKADLKLDGLEKDELFTRPEFEPVINLGPKCGLEDLSQIIKLDNLCSRLGVDSTSAASVIAFAMDLFEKKLLPGDLPDHMIDDLDLSWGNAATMEKLIYQMVEGKGLGKILSLGTRKAAEIIGNGASKHAAHIKGLELTAYHPAAIMGTALGYAVSSRGGDYNNVYASLEYSWTKEEAKKEFGTNEAVNIKSICAKGPLIKKAVTTNIIIDCLGLCKVPVLSLLRSFNLENEVRLINGLTDLSLSKKDLFDAGQKIANLEKLFNIRHENGDIEDKLPEMFIKKNHTKGLTLKNFETMLQEYYTAMGWDEKGIPPEPA